MTKGEIFTPMADDQLGRLSLIEAIRANTDAVNRLARHSEMQDRKLDEISASLGKIDTRLTVLEHTTLKADVQRNVQRLDELDARVDQLEEERAERRGAVRSVDWIFKNWPGIAAFIAMVMVVLVATGRVHF